MLLEKTLESPLDSKEVQPAHSKGDQSWVFIGRTDADAETPILWPPDVKSWLIGKDPDARKDWRKAGGKGADRGWDGWMASPIQWTWIWVNSGSWWWTGRPGMLKFMWSQRLGDDWLTEPNWSNRNGSQFGEILQDPLHYKGNLLLSFLGKINALHVKYQLLPHLNRNAGEWVYLNKCIFNY